MIIVLNISFFHAIIYVYFVWLKKTEKRKISLKIDFNFSVSLSLL